MLATLLSAAARPLRLTLLWLTCLAGMLGGAGAAMATPVAVTGITPNNGPVGGGTPVTISGSGFVASSTVRFGAAPATVLSVNSSESITINTA